MKAMRGFIPRLRKKRRNIEAYCIVGVPLVNIAQISEMYLCINTKQKNYRKMCHKTPCKNVIYYRQASGAA